MEDDLVVAAAGGALGAIERDLATRPGVSGITRSSTTNDPQAITRYARRSEPGERAVRVDLPALLPEIVDRPRAEIAIEVGGSLKDEAGLAFVPEDRVTSGANPRRS